MIGMAVVLIGTSAVTISYAKGSSGAPQGIMMSQQFGEGQNAEQFDNFKQRGNNQNGGNFGQPQCPNNQQGGNSQQPQFPNNQQGDSSQQPQAPNNQQGDSSQQPQAPNNQQNSDSQKAQSDSKDSDNAEKDNTSTNTSLSIEALVAEDSNNQSQSTSQQSLPARSFNHSRHAGVVSALCYMFAALQILILLLMIVYLIISKFNKISYNEVIANMRNNK